MLSLDEASMSCPSRRPTASPLGTRPRCARRRSANDTPLGRKKTFRPLMPSWRGR